MDRPSPDDQHKTILSGIRYTAPSTFMRAYEQKLPSGNSSRGHLFELAFCEVLAQEGIEPVYFEMEMTQRPVVDFDILLYQDIYRPISFSLKTSFRERWKQSYLEAVMLRMVYPLSKSYIVTLDADEGDKIGRRIKEELPEMAGCIKANTADMDELVDWLKRSKFTEVPEVALFRQKQNRRY